MKLENLELVKRLPAEGYRILVRTIVDIQFVDGEYRPWEYTIYRPSLMVAFCIRGITFEDGESPFKEEIIEELLNNNAVLELLTHSNSVEFLDPPDYFYSAEEDAEKLIQQKLDEMKPINVLLKDIDELAEKAASLFKDVDIEKLKQAIDLLIEMPAPKKEEKPQVEEKKETPKKRTRRTAKPKE